MSGAGTSGCLGPRPRATLPSAPSASRRTGTGPAGRSRSVSGPLLNEKGILALEFLSNEMQTTSRFTVRWDNKTEGISRRMGVGARRASGMHTDAIYSGDCQRVLANTIEFPDESVDLIYVDPPFFSNRYHEVIWHDGYELRAFEDRWKGGVENYIAWMEPKIRECHRILKQTGSMYLHCDTNANAHLRILMDQIFGESNLLNEVIWYYRGGGVPKGSFARRHDTIYLFSKGKKWTFNVDAVRTAVPCGEPRMTPVHRPSVSGETRVQ